MVSSPVFPPPLGRPTPPIPFAVPAGDVTARLRGRRVGVDDRLLSRLQATGSSVTIAAGDVAEASRDWWPLAMVWATEGRAPALAAAVVRPHDSAQVAAVVSLCHEARVPVVAAGGRSGVCGGSLPLHGGVVVDLCGLAGIVDVDTTSLVVDVRAGTFGDDLEAGLSQCGLTLGHWPQSIALSTVGGWIACRSAGQLSTRYGTIEEMVTGLDVVLADGRTVHLGGPTHRRAGPDLTQLFVGSEGTLGVVTGARLRAHHSPPATARAAFAFDRFDDGLDAMRRAVQRGATPAALRLYDTTESARGFGTDVNLLLAYDQGEPELIEATASIVAAEAGLGGGEAADPALVDRWLAHRNDTSALQGLVSEGYVVDTMEVSGRWADLPRIHSATVGAVADVDGTVSVSAHQSHSYRDGGCLYFTFAGHPAGEDRERYYVAAWDAGQRAAVGAGAALSHHHGVGLNRSRFVRQVLGPAYDVLVAAKAALDPFGILNPGKLGLPDPFGDAGFPP